jgi:activator of HSP90 ATPase
MSNVHTTPAIEQSVTFAAPAARIYQALLDSLEHSAFTGAPAVVSREVGGGFSCHNGCITGVNVALEENRRIVQAWRGAMFPPDVYSIATFELEALGPKETRLVFRQVGVPQEFVAMIAQGWHDHYWTPLGAYLADEARAA